MSPFQSSNVIDRREKPFLSKANSEEEKNRHTLIERLIATCKFGSCLLEAMLPERERSLQSTEREAVCVERLLDSIAGYPPCVG